MAVECFGAQTCQIRWDNFTSLLCTLTHYVNQNTHLRSNSNILKTLKVLQRTFLKEYSISFVLICRLIYLHLWFFYKFYFTNFRLIYLFTHFFLTSFKYKKFLILIESNFFNVISTRLILFTKRCCLLVLLCTVNFAEKFVEVVIS